MKTQTLLLAALSTAPAALAHTVFTDFFVDGVPQGDAVAMRMNPDPSTAGSPIASLKSDDMACNVGGTKGVSRVQSVPDGALLTFEIRSWPDDVTKERLDRGHKGPCALYLKKVASAIDDLGAGDGWFKLFDHGYNAGTDRWCTDEIIDNNGLLSVRLPKGLQSGYYLARPEILALHNAAQGDPQFYTGCAQIFLQGDGNLVPESTVSIPGYVDYNQPATSFNIYDSDAASYTLPGPPVAQLITSGAQTGSTGQTMQTEGIKPSGCLVENGNWCGTEVSSWTNEDSCWKASSDCWAQDKTCWASAPPTGGDGCELWTTKCDKIDTACNNGKWIGPTSDEQVVQPAKNAVDVGLVLGSAGASGGADAPKTSAAATYSTAKVATSVTPAPIASKEVDQDEEPAYSTAYPAKPASSAPAAEPTSAPALAPTQPSYPTAAPPPQSNKPAPAPEASKPAGSSPAAPSYNKPEPTHARPHHGDGNASKDAVAPTPTAAPKGSPQVCPKGWKCVYEVEVVTQWITVTVTDGYEKRRAGAWRA